MSAAPDAADDREAIDARFPTLARDGYVITSERDDSYNCVAWIGRDHEHWWEPGADGASWSRNVSEEELEDGDLAEFVRLFETWGFQSCRDGSIEDGTEKIAVYARGDDFHHVAYQRPDGSWSSKLGLLNDIRHAEVESLAGGKGLEYAPVQFYMSRAREPHDLADSATGLLLP